MDLPEIHADHMFEIWRHAMVKIKHKEPSEDEQHAWLAGARQACTALAEAPDAISGNVLRALARRFAEELDELALK